MGDTALTNERRGIADFKDGDSRFPCPDNPKATIEVFINFFYYSGNCVQRYNLFLIYTNYSKKN